MRNLWIDSDGVTPINILTLADMYAGATQTKKFFIQNIKTVETGNITLSLAQFGLSDLIGMVTWGICPDTLSCPFNVAAELVEGGSLTTGVKRYYRITAFNSLGETGGSIEVSATPTGTTLSIKLTWDKITGAAGYLIYESLDQTYLNARIAVIEDPDTLEWTDTGQAASPSGPYSFPGINTDFDLPSENTTFGESPSYGTAPALSTDDLAIGILQPGEQKAFWIGVITNLSTPERDNPRNALALPSET